MWYTMHDFHIISYTIADREQVFYQRFCAEIHLAFFKQLDERNIYILKYVINLTNDKWTFVEVIA